MARVIISLPDPLLEELDSYAHDNIYNRSECVRHAIRLMLGGGDYREKYELEKPLQDENDD